MSPGPSAGAGPGHRPTAPGRTPHRPERPDSPGSLDGPHRPEPGPHRPELLELALWAAGAVPRRAVSGPAPVSGPGGRLRHDAPASRPAPRPGVDALARAQDGVRTARERQGLARYAEATALADAALLWARRAGSEPERVAALRVLGVSLWQGPEPAGAAAFRIRALLEEHGAGRPAARLALTGPLAVLYGMRERWVPAQGALALARAAVAELDPAGGSVLLPVLTARVESLAGRTRQAVHLLEAAADSADLLGLGLVREAARRAVLRLLADTGRYTEAMEWMPVRDPRVEAVGDRRTAWSLNGDGSAGAAARIAAVRGHDEEALALAERAVDAAAATDSPVARATARLDQAEVFRLTGRRDEARRAICLAGCDLAGKGHVPGVTDAAARHAALASPPPSSPSPSSPGVPGG
ncbi:hypothetical protein ACIRPX_17845 [Streptomyces sp. NPDC101225]|uniref:hypothetical protein n=1 Tax=Streptomyces sp. NPDC101225 TaxID=3366135 RepID=UPI003802DBB5